MDVKIPSGFTVPPGVKLFALGHDFFTLLPGLFLYNTIFLREHNRVCDVLKKEHPEWNDERLFQTSKLVILGIAKFLSFSYFIVVITHKTTYKTNIVTDNHKKHGIKYT